jgi:hypothetical protein
MATESTEPKQPTESSESSETRPRCRCGRELRDPAAGSETPTCIGCDQPEATCACGPND